MQDGGAHKQVFCVKGEGGHKFCSECLNLFSVKSNVVGETEDGENETF